MDNEVKNVEPIVNEENAIVENRVVTDNTTPSKIKEEEGVQYEMEKKLESENNDKVNSNYDNIKTIADEAVVKTMLHVTHNDADAIGCTMIASNHKDYVAHTIFSAIGDADANIIQYLNTHNAPDFILITDISIREDTAVLLEKYRDGLKEQGVEVRLLLVDHHKTNTLSQKHDWAIVVSEDENGVPISAAKLLMLVIRGGIVPSMLTVLDEYIEKISRYDTWEWKRNPSESMDEENTNILIKQLGLEATAKLIYESMSPRGLVIPEYAQTLIDIYKEKRERYLPKVLENTVITNFMEYRIALWMESGEYFNESMEYIYLTNPEVDIVWALCPSRRSFSFRTNKDDINLGRFAKMFGGGGHPRAAGANNIESDLFMDWVKTYYNGIDSIKKQAEEPKIDIAEIRESITNIMNECRDLKLKTTELNYIDLLNNKLIPEVNNVLNLGSIDISREILLLTRTLIMDQYDKYQPIRSDINGTHGTLNNLLNNFRLEDEKVTPTPAVEEDIPEMIPDPEIVSEESIVEDPIVDTESEVVMESEPVETIEEEVEEVVLDGNVE